MWYCFFPDCPRDTWNPSLPADGLQDRAHSQGLRIPAGPYFTSGRRKTVPTKSGTGTQNSQGSSCTEHVKITTLKEITALTYTLTTYQNKFNPIEFYIFLTKNLFYSKLLYLTIYKSSISLIYNLPTWGPNPKSKHPISKCFSPNKLYICLLLG